MKNRRGQAMVEMALVLPILLLLLFGVVELGRLSNAYMVVMHAARHGARHGVVGATNEEIRTYVKNAASSLNPAELTITILPDHGRVGGNDIQVLVSYPVKLYIPVPQGMLTNPVTVQSKVTMRIE